MLAIINGERYQAEPTGSGWQGWVDVKMHDTDGVPVSCHKLPACVLQKGRHAFTTSGNDYVIITQ